VTNSSLEIWHDMITSGNNERLPEILADDCVFISPVVHTPQQGKALTTAYLSAATNVFNDSFHYIKEVVAGDHAVLEFVCEVDGITVNGVDIITFNEAGLISEFKVMVRPLKGMQVLHQKMAAMLEAMAP
jgi:SnoaL-like domain